MTAPALPKKLSVSDSWYKVYHGDGIAVYLDGVEQRFVVSYDMEAGTIERYKPRTDGQFDIAHDEQGDAYFVTEQLTGAVTVERMVRGVALHQDR